MLSTPTAQAAIAHIVHDNFKFQMLNFDFNRGNTNDANHTNDRNTRSTRILFPADFAD